MRGRVKEHQMKLKGRQDPGCGFSFCFPPSHIGCYLPTDLCFPKALSQLALLLKLFADRTLAFLSQEPDRKVLPPSQSAGVWQFGVEATAMSLPLSQPDISRIKSPFNRHLLCLMALG